MWAFAIWDNKERRLFLSRDRFGVKPLHYSFDGKRFAFASEMKAFFRLDGFSKTFDLPMVATAIETPHYIEASGECIVKGLQRLIGGHSLTLEPGKPPLVKRWWNTLEHLVRPPRSYSAQVDRFRELFFDACRIRMRSDVPIGTSLSGGLDSSSILCAMTAIRRGDNSRRLSGDWQRAFIATYPGTVQDERPYAEAVVDKTGATPLYREITPTDIVAHMDKIIYHLEDIYFDVAVGPWAIYREQRRNNVVVSLDGHGGDEILAGYYHYPYLAMFDALTKGDTSRLGDLNAANNRLYADYSGINVSRYLRMIRQTAYSVVSEVHRRFPHSGIFRIVHNGGRSNWLKIDPRPTSFPHMDEDRGRIARRSFLSRGMHCDLHAEILPTILRNFDRLSMAHGVEVRTPFLDWRLVCFAHSLPPESLIGAGFTKRILRDSLPGILPEKVRRRTAKLGFASPMFEWMRDQLKPFIMDNVGDASFRQSELWDGERIREIVTDAFERRQWYTLAYAWRFIHANRLMQVLRRGG